MTSKTRHLPSLAIIALFLASSSLFSQHQIRNQNELLLGVVTAPEKSGLRILEILEKSPAARVKLRKGDLLTHVEGQKLTSIQDLDRLLRIDRNKGVDGVEVELNLLRAGKKEKVRAQLMKRSAYRGSFFKRRRRGEIGFRAPEWQSYGWENVDAKRPAPTRANTKGKVVVVHTFQSW